MGLFLHLCLMYQQNKSPCSLWPSYASHIILILGHHTTTYNSAQPYQGNLARLMSGNLPLPHDWAPKDEGLSASSAGSITGPLPP